MSSSEPLLGIEKDFENNATAAPAKSIKAIDKTTVHRICSGQVVLTLATAVKELVENSLDAGATSVEVRLKEYGSQLIEVTDNGKGVEPCDFLGLTLKHHTSKLQEFGDLVGVKTFGFRGEALSSLCALSNISIVTRHFDQPVGTKLNYNNNGHILEQTPASRQVGTTVSLQNIFYTLPVRHKEYLRNIKKEFFKMVQVLYSYCLISTNVRIVCTNQCEKGKKTTVVSTDVHSLMKDNISSLFGPKQVASLLTIIQRRANSEVLTEYGLSEGSSAELSGYEMFEMEGFISSCAHGQGRSSSDRQFYFINNRPCDPAKIIRLVNEVYRHYNKNQFPVVVLNIKMQQSDVDVNVTPDKRQILVNQEKLLLATLKTTLICLYENIPSTFNIQNSTLNSFSCSSPSQLSSGHSTPNSHKYSSIVDKYSRTSPSVMESPKSSFKPSYGGIKRSISSISEDISRNKQAKLFDFSFKLSSSSSSKEDGNSEFDLNTSTSLPILKADESEDLKPECNGQSMAFESSEETLHSQHDLINLSPPLKDPNEEYIDKIFRIDDGKTENGSSVSLNYDELKENSNESILTLVNGDSKLNGYLDSHEKAESNGYKNSCHTPSNSCSKAHSRVNDFLNSLKAKKLSFTPKEKIGKNENENKQEKENNKVEEYTSNSNRLTLESREEKLNPTENINNKNVIEEYDQITIPPGKIKSLTVPCSIDIIKNNLLRKRKNKIDSDFKRKFRAGISPSDNLSAEEELQKEISKSSFSEMKIVGQFNLGFIITQLNSDLFMIDQHATDEKYNYETLQKSCVLQNQRLIIPQQLELTAVNEGILIDNLDIFTKNGFEFKIDESEMAGRKVSLLSMPHSKGWEFGKEDIEEMIFMLSDAPGVMCRPSRVQSMFASRSCRKSVMIGTHLSHTQMRRLVDHMGEIEQPWNCPHGRPTMRHLINVDVVSKLYKG